MTPKLDTLKYLPIRLGIARLSIGCRLVICIAVMAAYMVVSRILYNAESLSFAETEVFRTPFRLAAACLFWIAMADVIFARPPELRPLRSPLAIAGLGFLFAANVLAFDLEVTAAESAMLAIASFPVALFEELFFRAVLQSLLVKAVGQVHGIGIASICFILYHIGVISPDALSFSSVFLTGVILGVVYEKTGSLLAVTLIHAGVDVFWGLPLAPVLSPAMGAILVFISLMLFLAWGKRGV